MTDPLGDSNLPFNGELAYLTVELDHYCVHCGAVTAARVTGHDSTGGDGKDGQNAAGEEAAALIRLAPCPRCGRRNPRAVRRLVLDAVVLSTWGVALCVGAWVLLALGAREETSGARWVGKFAIAGGLLPFIAVGRALARWRGSVGRVHFQKG